MARIHAMKFYELAHAFDSLVRVGLDLVDEFVWVNDFIGAREVLERNLFPIMQGVGLVSRVLEARALYAVVLAYCGDHEAASEEVARLWPFEESMAPGHREAFQDQKRLIERVRRFGGPRQREVQIPAPLQALFDQRRSAPRAVEPRRKVGRNCSRLPLWVGQEIQALPRTVNVIRCDSRDTRRIHRPRSAHLTIPDLSEKPRFSAGPVVGGDGLEPPTLSV